MFVKSNIEQLRLLVTFMGLLGVSSVYRFTGTPRYQPQTVGVDRYKDEGSTHFLTQGGKFISFDDAVALFNRGTKARRYEVICSKQWLGARTSFTQSFLDIPRQKLSIKRKDIKGLNLLKV